QRPAAVLDTARTLLAEARQSGLTTLQLISDELPKLFEMLRGRGELTARVGFVPLGNRMEARGLYQPSWHGPAPEWVRVNGIKFFHDDPAQLSRHELDDIVGFASEHQLRV